MRVTLGLLVTMACTLTAKSQEPQPQSAFAVLETSSPTPAKASVPASDLADPPSAASDLPVEAMFPHFSDTRFWLSGQANFIFQWNPPFRAAYSGKHSLSPNYQKALSRVMTLYTGVRLNNSTEVLVDVEDAAGGGLSNALGLGGITNLDVVRIPGEGSPLSTAPYLARGMIHKVFALSKDNYVLWLIYQAEGHPDEADAEFFKMTAGGFNPAMTEIQKTHAKLGWKGAWQKLVARKLVSSWDLAGVSLAVGDKNQTIVLLQEASDERLSQVIFLNVDPRYDSLHDEPKFQDLLRRLGLRS